jgi:alpha-L-fucosidase 2
MEEYDAKRLICVAACCLLASAVMAAEDRDLTLWYRQPAVDWEYEALPIGNGELGGMLFGDTKQERIQLNHDTLWTGNSMTTRGSYQPLGDIFVQFDDRAKAADYRRQLDIGNAVHTVAYTKDGSRITQECFSSHPDQVPEGISGRIHLADYRNTVYQPDWFCRPFPSQPWSDEIRNKLSYGHDNNTLAFKGSFRTLGKRRDSIGNGLCYEARLRVAHRGGRLVMVEAESRIDYLTTATRHSLSIYAKTKDHRERVEGPRPAVVRTGAYIRFEKCREVIVYLVAETNYVPDHKKGFYGDDPAPVLEARLTAASARSYDSLKESHVADHSSFFERCDINVAGGDEIGRTLPTDERIKRYHSRNVETGRCSDRGLERLIFQYGRYMMIAGSRPGTQPLNLQGIWNNSDDPPWDSDYHMNINLQMNYWPAEPTNLSEMHLALSDWLAAQAPVWRKNIGVSHGVLGKLEKKPRGFSAPQEANIAGAQCRESLPAAAWMCLHLWEHYAFTQNEAYLRDKAYPIIKEIVEFWDDMLIRRDNGVLVTPVSRSPEHGPHAEAISYDMQIVHDLFTNFIEASEILGIDADYRAYVKGLRSKMLKPKIGRWGQLQEWEEDIDKEKDNHRHVSHLFAVYPGRQISPVETPKLAEAAIVSLKARGGGGTGWSQAWKINFWARLLDGDRAFGSFSGMFRNNIADNGFDLHRPFQIDGNFGLTSGVAEMLLQSHAGCIHVLPSLPGKWATGSARGLVARGNVVVDMEWADGKLVSATLRPRVSGPCRVLLAEDFDVACSGKTLAAKRKGRIAEFDAKAGMGYEVRRSR